MSKNRPSDYYPFATASRVLWQIVKYIVLITLAWIILFNFVLYFLAWGFKSLADSKGLQGIIDIFNGILAYVTSKQIPESQGFADGFARWVINMKDFSNISFILWGIGIIAVLYIGTIILRHHNREQAPFLNDMESKILKFRMGFALGAGKENMYDEDEKRVRKVEKAARRRLRYMRVYIHTKKEQGEAVPTKQYTFKIHIPSNDSVDNLVQRKIKNLPTRARKESGGITFGDRETTPDGRWYLFKGSKEAKLREANSVKKARKQKSNQKDKANDVTKKSNQKPEFKSTFPISLFVDKTQAISEKKAEAEKFAKEMQDKITNHLTSTEKKVTHQATNTGSSSVMYKYKLAFAKNQNSENQAKLIEASLSDALEVDGIIVQGNPGFLTITLPLKEGDEEDGNLRYDYTIPIDVADMIKKVKFSHHTGMLLGTTPDNKIVQFALSKQPHLLLAGATGSGKSVNIQQMLITMMYHTTPEHVKIGIVDPKEVDFQFYNGLPFMITDPIIDMNEAETFLQFCVIEMEKRKSILRGAGVRNIDDYNKWAEKNGKDPMPFWVIVVDEYADLVQEHPDVANPVKRLAQKARAQGIHMILGMQTPRADILKGAIKANITARIAMKAASSLESGIILDTTGAERLKPRGDMLILREGKMERAQGAFISDSEITAIFSYLKENLDKPIFPDFRAIVARANGEEVDEMAEGGSTPNSVTLSTNANRRRPNDDFKKHKENTQKPSIKGKTPVSTEKSHMQKLRERANKRRQFKENKDNEEVSKQHTGAATSNEVAQSNSSEEPKQKTMKKQMDMDFFLGKK